MCLKGQAGRCLLGAVSVVDCTVWIPHYELASYADVAVVWYYAWHPGRKAIRIAIVGALRCVLGTIEIAMEIHLFARIVFVDVLAVTHDLIHRVLDRVYATSERVLSYTYRVPKAPPKAKPIRVKVVPAGGDVREIEGPYLTVSGGQHLCFRVDIAGTSSADQQHAVD